MTTTQNPRYSLLVDLDEEGNFDCTVIRSFAAGISGPFASFCAGSVAQIGEELEALEFSSDIDLTCERGSASRSGTFLTCGLERAS